MKRQVMFLLILFFLSGLFFVNSSNAANLVTKLKGRILLQVELNGEAWYVNPSDENRYFLGRPADAFNLMKKLGIGITNNDLKKIQIADVNLSGTDNDNDGLSNMVEESLGTDKNNDNTDGDNYNDKDEVLSGYNPNGSGKNVDDNFAQKQVGKILLQVENNGEAWYVNPENSQRYFLGRPADAFSVMKNIGLGITNEDLKTITEKTKYYQIYENKTLTVFEDDFPQTIGEYNLHLVDTSYVSELSDGIQYPSFMVIYKNNQDYTIAINFGKTDSETTNNWSEQYKTVSYNNSNLFYIDEAEKPIFWITNNDLNLISVYYSSDKERLLIPQNGSESEKTVLSWFLNEFKIK